jgi:arylformamidase
MGIDYEAEYNNRARVPELPVILERWIKEAADYRDEISKLGRADLGVSYGNSPRQFIDLFNGANDQAPIALFIHGGFWRLHEPRQFSHMARGPNAHGVAVAVAGFDLCPQVTIAQIIDQIRAICVFLWKRRGKRITIYGHSAGGHLAAAMLATDWPVLSRDAPPDLVPMAYSISGLFDLAPLIGIPMNTDLRLDEKSARAVSPLFWPVPSGRVLDAVVGGDESSEFLRQSRIIVDGWAPRGVKLRYEAVPGKNHFTVLELAADPKSAMTTRIVELCKLTDRLR